MQFHDQIPADALMEDGVGILFENAAWMGDMMAQLTARGVPARAIDVRDAAFDPDAIPAWPVWFNRVSPSAGTRGHGGAVALSRAFLETLEAAGARVVNGSRSFAVETSKAAQHRVFRRVGVATPRTLVFTGREGVERRIDDFPFPAIVKPDTGGSGAGVRRVSSADELMTLLRRDEELAAAPLLLLQQEVVPTDGAVWRLELIGGEPVYAMRALPRNTFNLCPADGCVRAPADRSVRERPRVEFEHAGDVPEEAWTEARAILEASGLEVGGVEFLLAEDGTRRFIDVNATSVYRPEIARAAGVDPWHLLSRWLQRQVEGTDVTRWVA